VPALTRTISSDGLSAMSVSYPDGAMIIENLAEISRGG
jgi:hypothetical protein